MLHEEMRPELDESLFSFEPSYMRAAHYLLVKGWYR